VAIHAALDAGNYTGAAGLIGEIAEFENLRANEQNGTNVTVVKTALQLMGDDCGPTRPPSAWPLTAAQTQQLAALLKGWQKPAG
jgi:4-hydroxy-tetrahydrodipicolinate synthase